MIKTPAVAEYPHYWTNLEVLGGAISLVVPTTTTAYLPAGGFGGIGVPVPGSRSVTLMGEIVPPFPNIETFSVVAYLKDITGRIYGGPIPLIPALNIPAVNVLTLFTVVFNAETGGYYNVTQTASPYTVLQDGEFPQMYGAAYSLVFGFINSGPDNLTLLRPTIYLR